jgi:hypothetical protein
VHNNNANDSMIRLESGAEMKTLKPATSKEREGSEQTHARKKMIRVTLA